MPYCSTTGDVCRCCQHRTYRQRSINWQRCCRPHCKQEQINQTLKLTRVKFPVCRTAILAFQLTCGVVVCILVAYEQRERARRWTSAVHDVVGPPLLGSSQRRRPTRLRFRAIRSMRTVSHASFMRWVLSTLVAMSSARRNSVANQTQWGDRLYQSAGPLRTCREPAALWRQ